MALATFHLKYLVKDEIHEGWAYSETMAMQSVVGLRLLWAPDRHGFRAAQGMERSYWLAACTGTRT